MQYAIAIPQTYPDRVRLRRFLQRAEELPLAAAWCIEQMIGKAPVLESVTTLAYAAAVTERLRLGVAVLLIGQRNPIDLAKSLSSIEVLSNGRLIVGVGLGGSTSYYPAYGLAPEGRVARFRENLAIMKRLWTEEKVTLDGRFSHLMSIPMEPKPVQKPHPPIWFGGGRVTPPRGGARRWLHWCQLGAHESVPREHQAVAPGLSEAKRLYLALGDNLPRLREWFGAFYGKPEMADQVALWGSPQRIADQILRLKDAGVDYILLNPVFDEEAQMEQLCQDVLPLCRV